MSLLREPLLHFVVAGAVLFAVTSWLGEDRRDTSPVEPVRIGEGDVRWLKQTWTSQRLREPTADELKDLVDELLNEKLMAREAEQMGLDQDDTIIRRRLAQKLKFLIDDTARLVEPTDVELRQYYSANPTRFGAPETLSFRQIYFNPANRKDAAADAKSELAALSGTGGDADARAGDRLLLGESFDNTDELALAGMFGAEFADEVFALGPGAWRGPIKSGYGFHLVLVTQHRPTALKPFEGVRDAVLAEWRRAKQAELSREYLLALRTKYGADLDDSAKAILAPEPAPSVAAK